MAGWEEERLGLDRRDGSPPYWLTVRQSSSLGLNELIYKMGTVITDPEPSRLQVFGNVG